MSPEEAFDALVQSYKGQRNVTAGKMFASYGLKVNGKIFAMLYKGSLVVKLPAARADHLASTKGGEYFKLGKKVMKEWVTVHAPPGTGWMKIAEEAKDFVGGARPKRTKS
jgi:TfoX/Sxy family transcriptional regulator of competence genes